MKAGTWDNLKGFIGRFKFDHKDEGVTLGFSGWLCLIAWIVGAVIFVMACAAVFLPFLIGLGWIETVWVMAVMLWVSSQFLNFRYMYQEVEAVFIYIFDKLVRNRSWTYYKTN